MLDRTCEKGTCDKSLSRTKNPLFFTTGRRKPFSAQKVTHLVVVERNSSGGYPIYSERDSNLHSVGGQEFARSIVKGIAVVIVSTVNAVGFAIEIESNAQLLSSLRFMFF